MKLKNSAALLLLCLLAACGKEKTEAGVAEAPAPILDFKAISGISDSTDAQNVCPYVELAGNYKIGSSECSLGGKKVEVDYLLVPTRYSITEMTSASGSVEATFTRDGNELFPFSMDFPRLQTSVNTKKQGVLCQTDSEADTMKLYQACVGTSASGSCFNSIVKKQNKLFAITSRMKGGLQYWCKSNLRKVEDSEQGKKE